MGKDYTDFRVEVKHQSKPPTPYHWEIYYGDGSLAVKKSSGGYKTRKAAQEAGEQALRELRDRK